MCYTRSHFSMPRTGEGITVPHLIGAQHLGEGVYPVASIPDLLRSIYYTDMASPTCPARSPGSSLTLPRNLGWLWDGRQTVWVSGETKLTFTQLCRVWRVEWKLLGIFSSSESAVFGRLLRGLNQQLLLQPLYVQEVKGKGQTPHLRACAVLFKCPQACDWYRRWQGTNEVLWEK